MGPRRRQQFLGADQSQLRSLFGAEVVLRALPARQSEQSDISMQPAWKVSECCGALIVRMRRHEKDSRGNPGAFYGLDRFRQAGTRPGRWRKLRERGSLPQRAQSTANQESVRYPKS